MTLRCANPLLVGTGVLTYLYDEIKVIASSVYQEDQRPIIRLPYRASELLDTGYRPSIYLLNHVATPDSRFFGRTRRLHIRNDHARGLWRQSELTGNLGR